MIREPMNRRWKVFLAVASFLMLLAVYTHLSSRQYVENPNDTSLPTWTLLSEGVQRAWQVDPNDGTRWVVEDAKATFSRLFLGLFYGVVGAVLLGVLMGCFAAVESLCAPPLMFLAKIPPTGMLAVFIVLFGSDMTMYVAMIGFGVAPVLAQSVYLAVRDVPREMLFKAYTLGASNTEVIATVIFKAILPKVIDGVRLQIGAAMVYLIAAEMLFADTGFGYRIRMQQRLLNMSVVYPYLVLLAIFGFSMDWLLRLLQHILCPWYTKKEAV